MKTKVTLTNDIVSGVGKRNNVDTSVFNKTTKEVYGFNFWAALKEEATIKSIGASTRIEGSTLSDAEVRERIASVRYYKIAESLEGNEHKIAILLARYPNCTAAQITKALAMPAKEINEMLKAMLKCRLIQKYGTGPTAQYSIN